MPVAVRHSLHSGSLAATGMPLWLRHAGPAVRLTLSALGRSGILQQVQKRSEVLFVGAGLSAAAGYAMTGEILPAILTRLRADMLFESALPEEAFGLRLELEALLTTFMPNVMRVPAEDLPTITDILSLVDYLVLSSQSAAPDMAVDDVMRLRTLLELSICEVLSRSIHGVQEFRSMSILDRLADWIVNAGRSGRPISVITTNYDFVLEEAICRRLRFEGVDTESEVEYGFTWRSEASGELRHRPSDPLVRFIRLHGAINWLRCRMCGFVYINQRGPNFHQSDRKQNDAWNTCHCSAFKLQRVIVAPSIMRRTDDADLQSLWKAALEELRLATQWILLGYSLPNEDVAIRSIFMRALRGRDEPPYVAVFERKRALAPRFRVLFPDAQFSSAGIRKFVLALKI